MKQMTEAELRDLIRNAYEQGWSANEVTHNACYEGAPTDIDKQDRDDYIDHVMADL